MSYVFAVSSNDADFADKMAKVMQDAGLGCTQIARDTLDDHAGTLYSCGPDAGTVRMACSDATPAGSGDLLVFDTAPNLNCPGLLVMDMDMTSVQIEGIDEIARRCGVYDEVSAITAAAMHGEMDFGTALKRRVALLEGCDAAVLSEIGSTMPETRGLKALMDLTAEHGWFRGICSGGFVQLIAYLEHRYALQMVCANSLEIKDGCLTGRVDRPIVDAGVKRQTVIDTMTKLGLPAEQSVVIGDGANDLGMIEAAGFGLAYHAKPLVCRKAPHTLRCCDLTAVALLLSMLAKYL